MNKRISIIIPTYQHANTIVRCLESLFSQTRPPDEIIVVDDGSSDATQQILVPYKNSIISLVQKNQGAPIARNNGFDRSNGDLVMFCDADVVMKPHMLETLEKGLETHVDASYAYGGFLWGWKLFSSYPFDKKRLKKMNFIHTSALIRREDFPRFDPILRRFQDWDLWLTMLEKGKTGVFMNQCLYKVVQEDRKERMSSWLPSPVILFPWKYFGWAPDRVKKYHLEKQIILKKHKLL